MMWSECSLRIFDSHGWPVSSCGQRRLRSDWVDAHMSESTFSHIAAHMITKTLKSFIFESYLTITKTRLFKYNANFTTKKGKFSDKKNSDIFIFLLKT